MPVKFAHGVLDHWPFDFSALDTSCGAIALLLRAPSPCATFPWEILAVQTFITRVRTLMVLRVTHEFEDVLLIGSLIP